MCKLDDAEVYVSTYAKYNQGILKGQWVKLSMYSCKEDFIEACKKLHSDESNPEFMYQDWCNIPDGMIREYEINEIVFDLMDFSYSLGAEEKEALYEYILYSYIEKQSASEITIGFENRYMGYFQDEKSFAISELEEFLEGQNDFMVIYFDYSAYARDIFTTDYVFINGYVFTRY